MKEHFSIFTGKSTWSSISFNQFQWRNTQELKRNSPVIHISAGCIFLWGTSKVKKHIAIATRWKYCSYYRAQERWTWKSMSSSFTSQREIICNTLVFGAIWPYSMTLTFIQLLEYPIPPRSARPSQKSSSADISETESTWYHRSA